MLFANWRAESNLAAGGPQHVLTSIDAFYQSYTQTYMRKRARLQQYIECYEDEMHGTEAYEASREEQDMPPLINADEDMEEVTLTPTTVPPSTSELPIQSTVLPTTTSTTADTRESIIRTEDQLIADTEIY